MLPVFAALVIALLVVPIAALPAAYAQTPTDDTFGSVVTIPEDNAKMNMGVMVLGLAPTTTDLSVSVAGTKWFKDSMCSTSPVTTTTNVGPEVTDEPIVAYTTYYSQTNVGSYWGPCTAHKFAATWATAYGATGYGAGTKLLSQYKMFTALNGVPTAFKYWNCEVVEKEKAKIPPQTSKTPSTRQFPEEAVKTTLIDVSSNFICKAWYVKPGVYALDVYFVGPQVSKFIADHMLIITVGFAIGKTTVWASDLQDLCILGWSMDTQVLQIQLFPDTAVPYALTEYYYSWPAPMGNFAGCDDAALWQLAWLTGGWPY